MSVDNVAGSITFTITAADQATSTMRTVKASLDSLATSAQKLADSVGGPGGAGGGFLKATAASEGLSTSVKKTTESVGALGKYFQDLGKQATAFAAGLVAFDAVREVIGAVSEDVIGFNAHLEQSQVAWTTFLHSSTAATSMINELKTFAAATPFRFQGLEDSARLLTAMGVSGDKVLPLLTDIGNAVSATGRGAEGMQRVAYVMGEIQSLGQVDDRTLRQLTIDGGIPAFEMLAEAMGVTTGEIRKMASEGKITSDQFMTIFHNFVQNNWGDMMVKQSQTFNGALSTIQDNIQITIATGFEPLFDRVRNLTVAMANFSQSDDFHRGAVGFASDLDAIATGFDRSAQRAQNAADVWSRAFQSLPGTQRVNEQLAGQGGISGVLSTAGPIAAGAAGSIAGASAQMLPGISELSTAGNMFLTITGFVSRAMGDVDVSVGLADAALKTHADALDAAAMASENLGTSTRNITAPLAHLGDTMGAVAANASELASNEIDVILQTDRMRAAVMAANAAVNLANLPNAQHIPDSLDPGGRQNAIQSQKDLQAALADTGTSFHNLATSEYSAIAGLRAFDDATFGISQHLASVQLAIEQKRLGRMERRTPHTLGQEEALLEEQLKVAGLERQVLFGPQLRGFTGGSTTTNTAGQNAGALSSLGTGRDTYGTTLNLQVNVNDVSMVGSVVQGHIEKLINASSNPRSANPRLPGAQ